MSCKCSNYDVDEGRFYCKISGSQCIYLVPNSKRCADEFGEGPEVEGLHEN